MANRISDEEFEKLLNTPESLEIAKESFLKNGLILTDDDTIQSSFYKEQDELFKVFNENDHSDSEYDLNFNHDYYSSNNDYSKNYSYYLGDVA